jgi:hypothetical protein
MLGLMETVATCAHCGAVECETVFNACLVADFTDARFGIAHHLLVPAYALQHGWYTDEAEPRIVEFILAHLDRPPTDHDRRVVRATAEGSERVRARTPGQLQVEWDLNIAHVNTDSAEEYVATVRTWAASVAEILRGVDHVGAERDQ